MKYGFLDDVSQVNFNLPNDSQHMVLPGKNESSPKFHIGCSVWSDKDYVGNFFPEKTPQKNFLKEYAKQFNTVEVNATRYGVPAPKTMETWKNAVGDDFKLSFKVPQIISQRKELLSKDVLDRLDQYILAIDKMDSTAGTSFMLMQNNFSIERIQELEKFLQHLPTEQEYALEIRNPEFNSSKELFELLNQYNIANVITDTAGRRDIIHQMNSNKTAYIRFVGNGLVATDYQRIDAWIDKLNDWTNQGIENVYFLIHQPNQKRHFSALLVKYMIDQLNKKFSNLDLFSPIDYSKTGQKSLF